MDLIIHPRVRIEVTRAAQFYEERREGLGEAFLAAIQFGLDRIIKQPLTWPMIGHRVRRYVIPRFPYQIIYAADSERIFVVAVAHDRQKPGYWTGRLADV